MVDAAKFNAIREILDTRFPGLSSFADPRFEREEISYKKRAIETAQERLSRSALTELLHRKDYEGFIKALEEVGKKTNLLYLAVPTAGDLGVLYQPDLDKSSFAAAVFDLLHGKKPPRIGWMPTPGMSGIAPSPISGPSQRTSSSCSTRSPSSS